MAKTESTAVNELINLVQSGKPQAEPSADLFSAPKSTPVNPPRMTSAIPPMRGAGEVAPLPRGRAPHSTSQPMPAIPTPVRMSTADPERGNTIPPLSRPTTHPRATSSSSALPPPPRTARATSPVPAQRPSAPPPQRASSPAPQRSSSPTPQRGRSTVPSVPTLPPLTAPVAAPFESRPAVPQQYPVIGRPRVDMTGDVVKADSWFDVSGAVHKVDEQTWDGTAVVVKPRADTLALVKKLIVPTIILAIIGVMVGGFFAFDGDGGKKKASAAPAAALTEAAAPQGDVHHMATVPSEAAPAAVEAEPPTKAEAVAKQEATAEAAKAEPAPAEPASESMFPAATKAVVSGKAPEPAKVAAPKTEPAKVEAKVEAPKPAKVEAPKAEPAKAEAKIEAPATEAPVAVKSVKTSGAPPQIREVQTPRGVVKLVDVRIDSKPSGATVMLVDNGKTSFLGSTPLATSLDPTRKYDVIFTLAGRPTQMAPLDPTKTSRLDVTLSRAKSRSSSSASKTASASLGDSFVEKPAKADKKTTLPKADSKIAEPSFDAAKAEKKAEAPKVEAPKADKADKAEKKVAAPAGEGTLMVSSKPPCDIHIDGKPTGLTTPQRAIPLSAGVHKVTFVNEAAGIKKTVSVSIAADQSTKLIQDLMKK
ncbi:MAG TPA: hypothetical protein VIV11_17255 [Kofleriaceae bacterium]